VAEESLNPGLTTRPEPLSLSFGLRKEF
jgi:hypothetical protein